MPDDSGTVAGPADMSAGLDRLTGLREAMRAAGLPDDAVELGDFTADGGERAMRALIQGHPDVTAVFVASDTMAAGGMRALTELGRSVPDDIALFGFDDIGVAQTTRPQLSTVAQPLEEMAARAGAVLREVLRDGEKVSTEPIYYPPTLVFRQST